MDFKTLEKLGGKVTEVSATYSRKKWTNEQGTIGADFGAIAVVAEGADPDAVYNALYETLKQKAKEYLKETFEALAAPKIELMPPAEAVSTTPVPEEMKTPPNWCPIHGIEMPLREKDGAKWYSHKAGDDWCKGK